MYLMYPTTPDFLSAGVGSLGDTSCFLKVLCGCNIIDWENTKVLDREDREYPRQVREAIYIKKKKPSLNRDQGLELPSLYNGLL